MNCNEKDWLREKLIENFRTRRDVSVFLELRGLHQCKRNHEKECREYHITPNYKKFADIGIIKY